MRKSLLEELSVDAIAITDEESRCCVIRKRLDDLLCGPCCSRMSGDIEVNELASIMSEHDEAVKYSEADGVNGEEIDRGDFLEVVVDEGLPGLWRRTLYADPILPDRGRSDMDAEQRKLILDPWCTPGRIVA